MGLNAAVQALKKAEPLKDKVQRCKDLLNDNDAWVCQQQLQKIYQQVLILDLEYALDRKVEQELWNLGFKNYIATLQSQAKDRKNPKRGESQALLSWCLEAASGFYLTLLQEICTAFDLDLPFRRKGYVYGCTSPWKAVEKLSVPHRSSCFYACQYCLVHLGDIARYRNESKQAELFYRHAVSLSPSSGQPYNQLALLEASRGNKLGTVFHYARSVAVKHPFPVATTNLAKTLSSALNDNSFNVEGKTKLSSQEFIAVFLKLHGVIHNFGDMKLAFSHAKLLTETLTALIATESFTSWMLVQMLAINLYALEHTASIALDGAELLKDEELTRDERLARDCILDLIAGSLSALLLPVYTIKNSIVEYFALPSIKLCLDWIHTKPTVLEEAAFTSRLQIWPSLCVLLNALQASVIDFTYDQYTKVPLPEDRDLQGFLPLEKAFENLKFANTVLEDDLAGLNKLRAVRILHLGRYLTEYRVNGSTLISVVTGNKKEDGRFMSMSEGTGPSNELMKELEELSLTKERQPIVSASPVLSESASSKGSAEPDIAEGNDRRMGILKPQGSLERNRDLTVSTPEVGNVEPNSVPAARKPRQNVAMQAIMRRAETEQKQVTFKNVSPVMVEEESGKKLATLPMSPAKTSGKNQSGSGDLPKAGGLPNNASLLGVTQNPLSPLTSFGGIQGQPVSAQNQFAVKNPMLHGSNLPAAVNQQVNQHPSNLMPDMSQCLNASPCYPNQSFSVQNPQFAKNFLTNRMGNVPTYRMQGQLSGLAQAMPQNIGMQQHAVSQNRPMHQQRMPHAVSQSSLLQQSVGMAASTVPQTIVANSPQGIGLQQGMAVQQPSSHKLSMQQQAGGQPGHRVNGMPGPHNHVDVMSCNAASISALPTLSTYQKNLRQATTLTNVSNPSLSPTTTMSNPSLNFGQNTFGQGTSFVGHASQNEPPSPVYKSSDALELPFPNRIALGKTPVQHNNSYPLFQNYESTDFNLWKDTHPSCPPVPCWGPTGAGGQMHDKDVPIADTFQNWTNTSNPGNVLGRGVPLALCNSYQTSAHAGHFGARNSFEEPRQLPQEVDAKTTTQSINTGSTYSLFSGNTWGNSLQVSNASNQEQVNGRLNQQSLWSGPGPSPLERLLEQQKSLREGGT